MPKGKEQSNGTPISKMDAMRQALAKLGSDAKNPDIGTFLKKTFKIDMDTNAISSYKSKLKEETGKSGLIKKPAPEPEKEISKMDGVRKALAKLGDDAKPLAIQEFVKKKFDLDMDTGTISNYKTSITKKEAGKSAIIRKPAAPASTDAFSLDDILAVKDLAERIGSDNLRQLAAVLGK